MGELAVLGRAGDTKQIWDPDNKAEVEAAETLFDSLTKKGYLAFKVGKDGEKSTQMKKFSPSAGKVILVPPMVGG